MKHYVVSLAALVLFSCSAVSVLKTEKAPGADFTRYKTFDFYKLNASGDTISETFKANTDLLQSAVASEMQKRGYTRIAANPDLLINIGIVLQEKIQTRETNLRTDRPNYIGQRNYTWKSEEVEVGRYREGTVTVDIVDAAQNKLVWTAVAERVVPDKQSKIPEAISEGAKKLFEKYPVAVK